MAYRNLTECFRFIILYSLCLLFQESLCLFFAKSCSLSLEMPCCSVIIFSCDYQPSLVFVPLRAPYVGIFACWITLLGPARVHWKLFFMIWIKFLFPAFQESAKFPDFLGTTFFLSFFLLISHFYFPFLIEDFIYELWWVITILCNGILLNAFLLPVYNEGCLNKIYRFRCFLFIYKLMFWFHSY